MGSYSNNNNINQVKEATIITPSDPTPNTTLTLSTLDSQTFLCFTVEYLLVYPPSATLSPTQFLTRLKTALGRALVQYYPLAGRVVSSPGRALQLVCRAQGVVFVEAVSGFGLSDFERAPRHVEEWRELMWVHVDDVLKGAPVLVVQLTWLADGAVGVAFGFNHVVCDGIGAAEFINCFGDLTRGLNSGGGPRPVWDRHLLDPSPNSKPKSQVNLSGHPEFIRVMDHCGFLSKFTSEQLVPISSVFSKVHINHLKKQANNISATRKFTTFDVISAHIWRSWAESLKLPSTQTIKLLFSINIRDRIKPGLPSGFYGNGFVLGCAQTTVKDVTEKGLGYVSELIMRAKERVDDKYVREVIELVNGNKRSPDLMGVLILTQWSRLGLERVDFGLGKPAHVGPICSDKYCLLLPVQNQRDALRVMLAVPNYAVDFYQHLLVKPFSSILN
ncbi:hypothetical protein RND81_10G142600 [Saponaria officinalis]|uniref:Uncharacterized protein n=1 Tax=Saponaria officinalis TaxID=3572 RepID=A0AAW1I201_SAPOF